MKYIKTFEAKQSKQLNHHLLKAVQTKAALERVRKLIADGADVNCKSVSGRTPLMLACIKLWFNCIKILIDNGADVNATDSNGETPLMNIAGMGNYIINKYKTNLEKIINLLIESGTNLNIVNNNGKDVFDINFKEYVQNKYPEKYKEYLVKKSGNKYNL